jgi:signal transduction histidine kinase
MPERAMRRSLLPGGLRARLAAIIVLLVAGVVAASFFAVDRATRSELEGRIGDELREQFAEFEQETAGRDLSRPGTLERAAQGFIDSQRYHAESRIFAIEVGAERQVTSHPELVENEIEDELEDEDKEDGEAAEERLLFAPTGLTDVSTEETGELRVLSEPIVAGGERVGTFRVADPLEPVSEAEEGLRNAFLVVGIVALGLGILAAVLIADRITAPLRRAAEVATTVDAGDLGKRLEVGGSDEVSQLGGALNGMLDRLERAFERERGLVSDASHELRTPLTVLRGQVEMLERVGDDGAERDRIAASLMRELARMTRLVDDMLTLARADDDRLLEPRRFEVAEFLADLERDLPLLGSRRYEVDGPDAGVIEADPDRLSQVLRNLVRNAVEHTDEGGRVSVTATAADHAIEFAVVDDGPGIPPDELPLVFERFHRVDRARSRADGGSGLGLAIARAIVEAHGGRIWAENGEGGGAVVRFVLPGFYGSSRPSQPR